MTTTNSKTNGNALSYTPPTVRKAGKDKPTITTEQAPASAQTVDIGEVLARLARLEQENQELRNGKGDKKKDKPLGMKVAKSGTVVVTGIMRGVALYPAQWRKLLAAAPDILAFIDKNQDCQEFKDAEKRRELGLTWTDVKAAQDE